MGKQCSEAIYAIVVMSSPRSRVDQCEVVVDLAR